MNKIKQDAGRKQLGVFASEFAHFNDDILFGENWNNKDIDLKTRCIITVIALMSSGIVDNSLVYHLTNAKNNGVTQKEIAAIITHVGFYVGWPKAWAVFNLAKNIWDIESNYENKEMEEHAKKMIFPIGDYNKAYENYFSKESYLYQISLEQVKVFNVTFAPGCLNNWHIHHAESGGGQILICINGNGYYQEEGKEKVLLSPGDVINIAPGVKHYHGATENSWFSHIAIEVPGVGCTNEWLERVENDNN